MPRARIVRRSLDWLRRSSTQTRLLLAAKSALAAGIAWGVANLVPGTAGEYPYYAPLGAVISMNPTIVRSVRSGAQTLAGLALGAGIAVAFIALGRPTPLTVGLAVGVAMLLSSARLFGEQRGWVATAALFVLLLGYSQAEEYSFGYIVQMLIGVVIGLTVNLLFPPLYVSEGRHALDDARAAIERRLRVLAERLESDGESGEGDAELRAALVDARSAVGQATESRRGNPRARRHRGVFEEEQRQLASVERIGALVHELGDTVEAYDERLEPAVSEALASAIVRAADAVGAWNAERLTVEELDDAEEHLKNLDRDIDASDDRGATLRRGMTASNMLRRMQVVLRETV